MENKHPIDNLPQQYSHYGEESGGNLNESRHSNISTSTPRFCNKSSKIQIVTKHKTRIFWGRNQFGGEDNVPPRGENNGCNQSVQETLIREKCNPEGINKSNWKIDFDISSSPPISSTLLLITNVSDNKAEGQTLLRRQNKSEYSLTGGTKVVVAQSELEQRKTYKNLKCLNYNPVGCSKIRRLRGTGLRAGGQWSEAETQFHINVLEMKAAKLAIESFCRVKKPKSVHPQINNITAQSHLVKMGETKSAELNRISVEIWEYLMYLIGNKITLTAEHLPSSQNIQADCESHHTKDLTEWILCLQTFARTTQIMEKPSVDLFASHLSHQLPRYMSWKLDPCCMAVDALQQKWTHMFPYAFPPFSLIRKVLRKIQEDRVTAILITPTWQSQPWYPWLLKMTIKLRSNFQTRKPFSWTLKDQLTHSSN